MYLVEPSMAGAADANDDRAAKLLATIQKHKRDNPSERCWLLVDPSLRPLSDRPDADLFFTELAFLPIAIEHDAFPPEHRPCVAELDLANPRHAALLAESVRVALADRQPESIARGQGQRIGGWLFGSASPEEVVAHWSAHIVQRDERGSQRVLRFYDSRALSLMWPELEEDQRRTLLGPVQAWITLNAIAEPILYAAKGATRSRLTLVDDQWRMFHRHGDVNRALALYMADTDRQPTVEEVGVALAAATKAEVLGLSDRADVIRFVGDSLRWHPRFYEHPAVVGALAGVPAGKLYSDAVSDLDESTIEDIRTGLWRREALQ